MGMAASQARYLALVARKSNCEYEGQQINQARTVLANQSANLFNQMLGLTVPVPPSTSDYTKIQYSYSDGSNDSVIDSWQQLSSADPDYNYVVTHYYYTDRYTGSMKRLSDPQVQFSGGTEATIAQITASQNRVTQTQQAYDEAVAARQELEEQAATLTNYIDRTTYTGINESTYDANTDTYSFRTRDMTAGDYHNYTGYASLDPDDQALVLAGIQRLIDEGALDMDPNDPDMSDVYFDSATGDIAFGSDLNSLYGSSGGGTLTILPVLHTSGQNSIGNIANEYDDQIDALKEAEETAKSAYDQAVLDYEALKRPTYLGNSELTRLTSLTKDQEAEIRQVVADLKEQGIDASILDCYSEDGGYTGGIYSFQLNGTTYYTTYEDLISSYESGTGNNHIDGQAKLNYYNASYVSTRVEETEKALLETDGNGRFTSVRFENDSVTYTLNMETVTDDDAYQDAMNQYYYDNAVYDKTVQDINAQTSIIQQEDLQLELRLKQLDTEQSALSTEMEAVKKVVDDNVESSFKTFNG